ncbi:hypothetical protein F0A16_20525 [Salinicola corii]|uniref:Uncharacterized protein n=1 Tax=Salinicola corii TaxID=2606937 RepID=A0A640WA82_9GAMM|nr:hypothetical protein [Salinicola corii]KAA0015477.1 hypothetical protein F0A16_20525 [Salinicola corii]
MKALLDAFNERQRQIDSEGWKPEHDDTHTDGELAAAASTYAWSACVQVTGHALPKTPPAVWPFEKAWWKPATDPRRNLVKAAALILAEIERLDRARGAPAQTAQIVEWRPIEEAEKYGDGCLLHAPNLIHPDFNPKGVVDGYWQDDEGWIGAIWCAQHDCWHEMVIHPTHFMPKPDSPTSQSASESEA